MTNVSIVSNPRHRALTGVSGLHTMAVIGSALLESRGDWGTAIALGR